MQAGDIINYFVSWFEEIIKMFQQIGEWFDKTFTKDEGEE